MGRKLRYLPDDNHLVEITCRVIQRRFLLRPSPQLKAIIEGTLAYFQKRHGMRICGFVYLSNHAHLLLRPESVEQLAGFMRDVNSARRQESHGGSGSEPQEGARSGSRSGELRGYISSNTYSCWESRRVRVRSSPVPITSSAPMKPGVMVMKEIVSSGFTRVATSLCHSPKSK